MNKILLFSVLLTFAGGGTSFAQTSSEQPIDLTADECHSDMASGLSVCTGSVVIVQGAAELKASRVEVAMDKNNQATQLKANGKPVFFVYKGKKQPINITGDKVEYNVLSSTVNVTGNVVVTQGGHVLKGNKASYNLRSEKVDVARATLTIQPAKKKKN